ncbi:MAG: tRNA (guanosine(46)-N7)-methyltransferase TrmB [Hyphomicrobiales bacterium]|nr:MAG: tRNA (guanosine(46)-N7)-methyltransferase TrmB [Hyphomicrobiales bacterium]
MIRRSRRSDFIGRRQAKTLKPRQAGLFKTLMPKLRLDIEQDFPQDLCALFNDVDDVRLEIGFGGGEHLVHRAQENPRIGFIGVEPFINGMGLALSSIDDTGVGNILLHDEDAGALMDLLPQNSLSQICLLYPDPWPKYRHWKRRFVSQRNLDRMARLMKPGAQFLFASDIEHYVGWTLDQCHHHASFQWLATGASDWNDSRQGAFANWPSTRYEAKAFAEGRKPTYLTFEYR